MPLAPRCHPAGRGSSAWPASTWTACRRPWPRSASRSPRTSATRCSANTARPPRTARRRAPRPTTCDGSTVPSPATRTCFEATTGRLVRDVPGAGAAGGTTAGLLAIADRFQSLGVRPGVEEVMGLAGFEAALHDERPGPDRRGPGRCPDAVRQDGPGRRRAGAGGRRALPLLRWRGHAGGRGGPRARPAPSPSRSWRRPTTVEAAMAAGPGPVERAAERTARLIGLWSARPVSPRRRGQPWPLERRRPGLMAFVLERLAQMYGAPTWQPRRDGTSELVLTILSQHTSDLNAERAFDELRRRFPTWDAVEAADPADLAAAIRSGGLAAQKAPRIREALTAIREARGDYDLDFLAVVAGPRGAGLADPDPGHRTQDGVGRAALLLRPAADAHRHPCRAGQPAHRPDPAGGRRRPRPRRRAAGYPRGVGLRGPRQPHHPRASHLSRPATRPATGASWRRAAATSIRGPPEAA